MFKTQTTFDSHFVSVDESHVQNKSVVVSLGLGYARTHDASLATGGNGLCHKAFVMSMVTCFPSKEVIWVQILANA